MKPSIAYNLTGGALYGWVAIPSHIFLQLAPRGVNSAGSGAGNGGCHRSAQMSCLKPACGFTSPEASLPIAGDPKYSLKLHPPKFS